MTLAAALAAAPSLAEERRHAIAVAIASEDPGVRLEGLGFTGAQVRESFQLAARALPVELVFYDNERGAKAIANAEDAIRRRADLFVQYCPDAAAAAESGRRLQAAGIKLLAVGTPVPDVPLYTPDNAAAGRLAGEALARFAATSWRGATVAAVIAGHLSDSVNHVDQRAEGVAAALREKLERAEQTRIDSGGNPAQLDAGLRRFLAAQAGKKIALAATDDATALLAKSAIEAAGRTVDAAIVSHGCDRSVHGGYNDKREIDPNNRASIVLGSVAYFLDRYGFEILPIAMRMLAGEAVPAKTSTKHVLVTASNVFTIYPPTDMN